MTTGIVSSMLDDKIRSDWKGHQIHPDTSKCVQFWYPCLEMKALRVRRRGQSRMNVECLLFSALAGMDRLTSSPVRWRVQTGSDRVFVVRRKQGNTGSTPGYSAMETSGEELVPVRERIVPSLRSCLHWVKYLFW